MMDKVSLDNDLESVCSSSTQGTPSLGMGVGGGVVLERDGTRFIIHLEVGNYTTAKRRREEGGVRETERKKKGGRKRNSIHIMSA